METTLRLCDLGAIKDNRKENGSHYDILGLYADSGKENASYCFTIGYTLGLQECERLKTTSACKGLCLLGA